MESSSPPTPPPPRKSSSTGRVRRAASLKAQKNLQNEKPVKRKRVKRMASSVEVPLAKTAVIRPCHEEIIKNLLHR